MANKYICIHGHFYQPPRENPWLERIEKQDSAHPYHDWNERITAECYAPNAASRIIDNGRIADIINNYSLLSFNFGPTLLSWMEDHQPEAYEQILEADRLSLEKFSGHGSAIAQVYNHMIMPLANSRDKHTQVYWGIKDFEYRFGRKPEGMWLAETAVDTESLEVLAEQGIKYTILAPRQAHKIRKIGDKEWTDVTGTKVDPRRAYLCKLPSGNSIHIFYYDGPVAQDVAFGGLLADGQRLADRLYGVFSEDADEDQLVHTATDGESYGHHHRFGDMALAFGLYNIENDNNARITIYGEYLDLVDTEYETLVYDNSSWSCAHGVERWRNDCGCNSGGCGDWQQKWRAPLRSALDTLRDQVALFYENKIKAYGVNPWDLRNAYIDLLLNRTEENTDKFFADNFNVELSKEKRSEIIKLLEMQRHAMLMYTSCGWFFDEISGIETVQIIMYAARVIQLAHDLGSMDYETTFVKKLRKAPSNIPELKDGAGVYEKYVKPSILDVTRIGVHYAINTFFQGNSNLSLLCCYESNGRIIDDFENKKYRMMVGTVKLRSLITLDEYELDFVVVDGGAYKVQCCVANKMDDKAFKKLRRVLKKLFDRGRIDKLVALMSDVMGGEVYSLRHLFADERREILSLLCADSLGAVGKLYKKAYDQQYSVMKLLRDSEVPMPPIFAQTISFVLNNKVMQLLQNEVIEFDKLREVITELKQWADVVDKQALIFVLEKIINNLMQRIVDDPDDKTQFEYVCAIFRLIHSLHLDLDLWKAQNIYFSLSRDLYPDYEQKAEDGDIKAGLWLTAFESLAPFLNVKHVS